VQNPDKPTRNDSTRWSSDRYSEGRTSSILAELDQHSRFAAAMADMETRRMGGTKFARVKINYKDKDKEFAFREFFGTKVEISRNKNGGQILIVFYSNEELEAMAEKIKK